MIKMQNQFLIKEIRVSPMTILFVSSDAFRRTGTGPRDVHHQGRARTVLKEQTAKNVVDQPIKATNVIGGKASVARLRRVKPEASALIHDYVTETYYIMSGSGTFVTGGSLGGAKPTDLSNVNAGMSQTGARIGGEARRVKAGDIVIVPAGTPHSFSELDGPIDTWFTASSRRRRSKK